MKKKITFIINPLAGGKNKKKVPKLIEKHIDKTLYDVSYSITGSETETIALSSKFAKEKPDAIIAIGGDGTINNIAKNLTNTGIALGIIPMGSGNGFARELGIPMDVKKALQLINNFKLKTVDSGLVNQEFFINICGVGFDAHISSLFAGSETRGLKTYANITLQQISRYKAQEYEISIDGNKWSQQAFMMVVCNGTQFGNNAFIAPKALLDDSLLNITIIEDFKWLDTLVLIKHIFFKSIENSKKVKTFAGNQIQINRKEAGFVNIDGEPVLMPAQLTILIKPVSLKIIVP